MIADFAIVKSPPRAGLLEVYASQYSLEERDLFLQRSTYRLKRTEISITFMISSEA